ncbi:hypothetical protein [Trichococcus flocculiformis]|uniref:hypothetical protein n=1 Tax=Trichococcus flocculiformis TaxID=82803 RepID=UPI0023F303F5|nr:hypothetical protein [Trichococcus flocculiformis]
MKQIDAAAILEITITGTSATLLAKRWESALLVNVDNATLSRLINNKEALAALMRIEGFRSLNSDIETIINKSEAVKKVKKEREERLSPKEKTELSEEEKKYKSLRKDIQEKLIKFATRIPIFMYLTDFREHSLKDVITQLEPGLFKKVTGLEVNEFELLVSLGVFNGPLMNDAVYKFKRYEDSSLSYTGINKHADDEKVGYWDTVVSREEHMARMLSGSMQAPQFEEEDLPDFEEAIEDVVDEDDPDEEGVMRNNAVRPVREERPRSIEPGRATSRLKYSFEAPGKQLKPVAENHSEDVEKGNQELAEKIKSVSVGTCVFHQRFGAGKVIELEGQYVLVKFEQGEKRFLYPESFEKGLMRIGGNEDG